MRKPPITKTPYENYRNPFQEMKKKKKNARNTKLNLCIGSDRSRAEESR
jgi:hypothetical protein